MIFYHLDGRNKLDFLSTESYFQNKMRIYIIYIRKKYLVKICKSLAYIKSIVYLCSTKHNNLKTYNYEKERNKRYNADDKH